jgi:hypothetical protein
MMIKRLFWFALGAGAAIFGYLKLRGYLQRARPSAVGTRVSSTAAGVGQRAQGFVGRLRTGMAEREAELREELDMPE